MVRAVSKYSLLSILASTIPVRLAQRRRTTINHRGTDRAIAQTFISALHLFETMILRFTIDHPCASRVVGTWLLVRRLPSDIGRSAGDAVVRQVRSRGRQGAAKRQSVSSARLGKTHGARV